MRKTLLIILTSLAFINLNAQYGGGSGTNGDPYLISTPTHIISLSNTSSDWNGKYFKLTSNVDMVGQTFTPIGNTSELFTGNFEGDSYVISNLTITPNANNVGTGFIGGLNGTVNRLGLENISITAPGINRTGGIVGYMLGGSITKCYTKGGSIDIGNGGWSGSIVGVIWSGGTSTIQDCYSSTNITASWGSGGIIGATREAAIIDRVVFYGTITGNNAIVTVQSDAGNNQKNGIPPTNSFFAASTGASDSNAVSLNASELQNSSNYTTFDFDDIWAIDGTLNYAILKESISDPELEFFDKIRLERIASNDNVQWLNFGPGASGYCEEYWCHPTDKNTMFMGPDMLASFGTWDNGATWQTIKGFDGVGLDMRRVIDMKFSLQDPNYGIAFSMIQSGSDQDGELFESTDRGRTWSLKTVIGKAHSKIAIHPTNDNIWFLGAGDFYNIKSNLRTLAKPNGIKQDRASYGYVWKTTDKGETYTKVATGISNDLDVGRIIFNPNNPDVIVMATGQGMYRSTDGGTNWSASNTGLPNNLPKDLTSYYNSSTNEFVLYTVEQTIYAPNGNSINTSGGIYKSTDAGLTWQSITGNLGINLQTITDYWPRDRYHRTVAHWLGISKAVSKATYTTYPSWTMSVFNRIVINPTNKNEIYISHNKKHDRGFGPGDIWKTEDGGVTWFACARNGQYWINETDKSYWQGKSGQSIGANIDFAHLQKSMDEGSEGSGTRYLTINNEGTVFTNIDQQNLRSDDGGDSWYQVDDDETVPGSDKWIGRGGTNLPGRFMLHETGIQNRRLLCSGEHGLWEIDDLGSSTSVNDVAIKQIEGQNNTGGAHSIATVAVDPNDTNKIFMLMWRQSHRGKLRYSPDGGQTWSNRATILEASNAEWQSVGFQHSLLIDPNNSNNMYFCAIRKAISEVGASIDESIITKGGYGVFKSTDAGFTWNLVNTGLPANGSVRRLTMDPSNLNILYASISQFGNGDVGGLYKSVNSGVNWSKVTLPSAINSVNNLFIDRNTNAMFLSTGARQGAVENGGVWKSTDNGTTWNRIFEAPYIWQTEVSPVNSNIITVSVPALIPSMANNFKNPGAYLSVDGGSNWIKINRGLAHCDRIVDIKPDPYDETVLWCAGWGSAWYKATIDLGSLGVEEKKTKSQIKVFLYPNPVTNGELKISGLFTNNSQYEIVNILGKRVVSGLTHNNSINVSTLDSGIYFLTLHDKNKTVTRKFMVSNH